MTNTEKAHAIFINSFGRSVFGDNFFRKKEGKLTSFVANCVGFPPPLFFAFPWPNSLTQIPPPANKRRFLVPLLLALKQSPSQQWASHAKIGRERTKIIILSCRHFYPCFSLSEEKWGRNREASHDPSLLSSSSQVERHRMFRTMGGKEIPRTWAKYRNTN